MREASPLSQSSAVSFRTSPVGAWDVVWMTAVVILMAVFWYIRSRHRIFWGDELAAMVLMREKSYPVMLHNWRASLDSGSLFYETFGRWWVQLFSASEISLRAFSAAGVASSFIILWLTARRFYSIAVVGICLPFA